MGSGDGDLRGGEEKLSETVGPAMFQHLILRMKRGERNGAQTFQTDGLCLKKEKAGLLVIV